VVVMMAVVVFGYSPLYIHDVLLAPTSHCWSVSEVKGYAVKVNACTGVVGVIDLPTLAGAAK
jgi:hypothetical protein